MTHLLDTDTCIGVLRQRPGMVQRLGQPGFAGLCKPSHSDIVLAALGSNQKAHSKIAAKPPKTGLDFAKLVYQQPLVLATPEAESERIRDSRDAATEALAKVQPRAPPVVTLSHQLEFGKYASRPSSHT